MSLSSGSIISAAWKDIRYMLSGLGSGEDELLGESVVRLLVHVDISKPLRCNADHS